MSKEHGFSLIELLIVVTIIGIIAALAVPNMLAARRAANEGSAISSLRSLHSAQVTYHSTKGAGDFGDMAQLLSEKLVDPVLGSNSKSGYNFTVNPSVAGVRPPLYWATAVPSITSGVAVTGKRRFGISEDGMIHGDNFSLSAYANEAAVKNAPGIGN